MVNITMPNQRNGHGPLQVVFIHAPILHRVAVALNLRQFGGCSSKLLCSSPTPGPMGFYAKYVLPCLIDVAMSNKETARLRAAWIPQASGKVLEVGIGSGLNLPFYSSQVEHVYGVDPSLELQQIARKRIAAEIGRAHV